MSDRRFILCPTHFSPSVGQKLTPPFDRVFSGAVVKDLQLRGYAVAAATEPPPSFAAEAAHLESGLQPLTTNHYFGIFAAVETFLGVLHERRLRIYPHLFDPGNAGVEKE